MLWETKPFMQVNSGSGQIAKLCNNMLLAVHMCGTAETLAIGVNNGLDPISSLGDYEK